nr:hypothetical protein Q903MT_gene512 [Picea sitchensis]
MGLEIVRFPRQLSYDDLCTCNTDLETYRYGNKDVYNRLGYDSPIITYRRLITYVITIFVLIRI